jgi:DNA-binding FrmR family transcriptional regulator
MSHLPNYPKVISRIRRIKGQAEAIERMLGDETDCYTILQTVAACRGALNALTKELLTEHLEHHLIRLPETPETARDAAREIQAIINSYFK